MNKPLLGTRPEPTKRCRRAPALASRRRRSHPERPGRGAVLEGVREPDRARQDTADGRDARVAGGAVRGRPCLPRQRRQRGGARARRGRARSRGGAARAARLRRGCPGVRGRARRGRRNRRARPGAALAARRDLGADPGGADGDRDAAARTRTRSRRTAHVHRRRPRGRPSALRRHALPPFFDLHGDRAPDRGARARHRFKTTQLPACRATRSAATSSTGVPAATAASATGSRPARTSSVHSSSPIPQTTSAPPPRRTSRRRSSPSGRAAGCSRGRTRSGRAATTKSWKTGPRSAGC